MVLKEEVVESSEMCVFYVISWCHSLEDHDLNLCCHGNLKSYIS